jgi:hypothetical protein
LLERQRPAQSRRDRYRNTTSTYREQKSAIRQTPSRQYFQSLPKPLQVCSKKLSRHTETIGLDRMNLRMLITLNHAIQPHELFPSNPFHVLIILMAIQPNWILFSMDKAGSARVYAVHCRLPKYLYSQTNPGPHPHPYRR